jgi:natural product precursor
MTIFFNSKQFIIMNFSDFKNSKSLLTQEQMRNIKGGGSCGFKTSTGTVGCGYTKTEALFMVESGGNWCCESCATSSYCGEQAY